MQNQSDNKFDEFIRSEIDDLKIDTSFEEQWDKMSSALDKKDFMYFSVYRFNIYYLSAIIISLLALLGLWFFSEENDLTQQPVKQNSSTTKTYENKPKNTLPNKIVVSKNNLSNASKSNGNYSSEVLDTKTKSDFKSESEIKPLIDTIKILSPVIANTSIKDKPDSLVKTKPIFPKKIKYVTKRDTIIKIDTTKVRRKR